MISALRQFTNGLKPSGLLLKSLVACLLVSLLYPMSGESANLRLIELDSGSFQSDQFCGTVNDAGSVAWLKICPSYEDWPGPAVYVNQGSGRVRIADSLGDLFVSVNYTCTPSINNSGTIAFLANMRGSTSGSPCIFLYKAGIRSTLVNPTNLPPGLDLWWINAICSMSDDERVTFIGQRASNSGYADLFSVQTGSFQTNISDVHPCPSTPVPLPVSPGDVIDLVAGGWVYSGNTVVAIHRSQMNARGQVLMELSISNIYSDGVTKSLALSDPPNFDLAVESLHWNTNAAGIDFVYSVQGAALPKPTLVKLFWSKGAKAADILPYAPIFTQGIPAGFSGQSSNISVASSNLLNVPSNATHVSLVLDPDYVLVEAKTNNIIALAGVRFEIAVSQSQPPANGQFHLQIMAPFPQVTLQASGDLLTWTNVATLAVTNGTAVFADTNAGAFGQRYYRARP